MEMVSATDIMTWNHGNESSGSVGASLLQTAERIALE
jgi:hypothetical protein